MKKLLALRSLAACATLVLGVGIGTAGAQDFLSPNSVIQHPVHRRRPARTAARAARPTPSQAAAGRAPIKPNLTQEIGDWRLLCFPEPNRVCKISQRRVNPKNQALLIWVELTQSIAPKPGWEIAVMVPLGLRVFPNLNLHAGQTDLVNVPIVTCVPAGCVYATQIPVAALDTLQRSRTFGTVVSDLQGHNYALNLSMKGFNQAFLKSALVLKEK